MGDYGATMVGIDLGTTYSRVAVWRNNRVTVIPNESDNLHTPSCVAFTDSGILIGDTAKEHASENPTNTIPNIKRLIQRCCSGPSIQNGTKVIGGDINIRPKIVVNGNGKEEKLEPEEVASLLFGHLKEIAENHLGSKVTNAVVTVPASFNASQCKAIKEAADVAGLSVALLEEPISAVLAYGLEKESKLKERNVLVFDFGGGSLDVSVVTIQGKELKVKATVENTDLGGQYFDERLAKYCQSEMMLDANENPEALRRLLFVAEKAKSILSSADQSISLYRDIDWEDSFTLGMLERMNQYIFQPCINLVAKCLMNASVDRSQIDDVIIAGGLSNISSVQELLRSFFKGKQLHKHVELDEVVVRGAAIQAAILSGEYSSISSSSLVDEHADKSSSLKRNTGRYNSSNWIWMCSLAAVATVSFLFVPRACNHLHTKQGWSKQWSAKKGGDQKEHKRNLETRVGQEKQTCKLVAKNLRTIVQFL